MCGPVIDGAAHLKSGCLPASTYLRLFAFPSLILPFGLIVKRHGLSCVAWQLSINDRQTL
jgi:hypothetical protein